MKTTNKTVEVSAPVVPTIEVATISVPTVSESLLNGSSRLAEIAAASARIEASGKPARNGKVNKSNKSVPAVPPAAPSRVAPASIPATPTVPADKAIADALLAADAAPMELDGDEEALKLRFQTALTEACKGESNLSVVVADMVASDIGRDEAIDWGIEAGLSESYVRNTVSRLYTELTGERVRKAGGGRKPNKGAKALAERVLRECDGDFAKAKALLLAARTLLDKQEKSTKAK